MTSSRNLNYGTLLISPHLVHNLQIYKFVVENDLFTKDIFKPTFPADPFKVSVLSPFH